MASFRELLCRASAFFRSRRLDAEMQEEMRIHLELRTQSNIEAGMPPDEARYAARRQFGGVAQLEEICRGQRGFLWLDDLSRDLRYGARMLRKSPVFTAVAVLSLALGIGANTAIFSLLDAVLLRPLPVGNPGELRAVNWVGHDVELSWYTGAGRRTTATGGRVSGSFPYATYRDFRDKSEGRAQLFAFSPLSRCTALTPEPSVVDGLLVSGNFFQAYDARTMMGRPLTPADDQPDAPPVAVITHRWWAKQFGLDPLALGRVISINRVRATVVGILPHGYRGPVPGDPSDFYASLSLQPQLLPSFPLSSYHHWWVEVMARLTPGADERPLQAVLETVFRQALTAPGGKTKMNQPRILLEDGSRGPLLPRERMLKPIYVLLAAVGLILLIVCANLACLMLARTAVRRHEYALRAAIGAGRGRLVRQLLIESLMLALAGAVVALFVADWGRRALLGALSGSLGSYHLELSNDWRVVLFTFAASLATVLLFGLLPALRAANTAMAGLKDRAGSAPRLTLGKTLVTVQVGLSVLLVFVAALFLQTFGRLARVAPGFDAENLLLFSISPDQAGYEGRRLEDFYDRLNESLRAIGGVRGATFSDVALLGGRYSSVGIKIPGKDVKPLNVGRLIVGEGFLSTMRIPLVIGRALDRRDAADGPKAAVVNESLAREYFPGENPLGKSLMLGRDEYRVAGVCRDARFRNLRGDSPILYTSFRQDLPGSVVFEVRTHVPPESLAAAVRKSVALADPAIPLTDVRTQAEQIAQLLTMERLFATIGGLLAMLALLLSCIGLYGLVAYDVARRTTEIGIRIALGASPRQESRRVVGEALRMSGAGALVGLICAVATGRAIESQLFGVTPSDPPTLIATVALLLAVALAASWLPSRRAARIDPLAALRSE